MGTPYRSYAPPVATAPQVAPSPADAPSPQRAPSPRYAYLVARLRGRQITMEEATELFQIQQQLIQGMLPPAGTAAAPSQAAPAQPSAPGSGLNLRLSDDTVGVGLIALGAAAGLLAAMLARAESNRRSPSPLTRTPPP
jgi:hypothetical protein